MRYISIMLLLLLTSCKEPECHCLIVFHSSEYYFKEHTEECQKVRLEKIRRYNGGY